DSPCGGCVKNGDGDGDYHLAPSTETFFSVMAFCSSSTSTPMPASASRCLYCSRSGRNGSTLCAAVMATTTAQRSSGTSTSIVEKPSRPNAAATSAIVVIWDFRYWAGLFMVVLVFLVRFVGAEKFGLVNR